MANFSQRPFWFPVRKFDDKTGLFKNFRYLEDFLSRLAGGVDTYADHGNLAGLSDDDHAEYLKEKAFGGTAAETPIHTHASTAEAGTVAHSALTGIGTDDHHPQSHNIASHSDTTATGAELNTLTDGSTTTLHAHAGGGGSDNMPDILMLGGM